MLFALSLVALLAALLSGCGGPAVFVPEPLAGSAAFADAAWDDGQAVVSVYRGRLLRYGVWRDAEVRDYLVREFLDPHELTKRDAPGPDAIAVLKAVRQTGFSTGSYDYALLSTLFFRRADERLLLGRGACLNACGLVTQRWDARSELLQSDSYWEGEGLREQELPASPATGTAAAWRFADELPFVAAHLEPGACVLPLAALASPRAESAASPAMGGPSAALCVQRAGGVTRLLDAAGGTAAEYEHDAQGFLLAWRIPGQEEFRLVARFRGPYWERTDPADARLPSPAPPR